MSQPTASPAEPANSVLRTIAARVQRYWDGEAIEKVYARYGAKAEQRFQYDLGLLAIAHVRYLGES